MLQLVLASWLLAPSVAEGSVSRLTIRDDTGRAIEFVLYLPPSYDRSDARYPVIYHLHGLSTGSRDETLAGIERSVRLLAVTLEKAVAAGEIGEAVLVAPYDGAGFSMWSDSKDGSVLAESDLVDTLLPYVDAAYRTFRDREHRVIQGFSMGGYGAVKNALKFPQHFALAINYDGALHDWDTLTANRLRISERVFGGDRVYYDRYSPWTTYGELGPWSLRIKSNVGLLKEYNQKLRVHLETVDVVHDYGQTPCGHDLECLLEHTGIESFRFIGDAIGAPAPK